MTEQRRTSVQAAGVILVVIALLAWVTSAVLGASVSDQHHLMTGSGSVAVQMGTPGAGAPGSISGPGDSTGQAAKTTRNGTLRVNVPIGDGSWQDGGDSFDWVHVPTGPIRGQDFGLSVDSVTGLYPGARVKLPITFSNPKGIAIKIAGVTIAATDTTDCPASSLRLGTRTFATPVIVSAHQTAQVRVRFGMRKAAPDGCQGSSLDITVSATAVAA